MLGISITVNCFDSVLLVDVRLGDAMFGLDILVFLRCLVEVAIADFVTLYLGEYH